jgi:penicillin-binding protein 2
VNAPGRVQLLVLGAWTAFFGLATRLYALQIRRGDEFKTRAERRRRRVDFLPPRRGKLLDRKGRPFAFDRSVHDVVVELTELDPALDLVPRIGRATRAPIHEVAHLLKEAREKARAGAAAVMVGIASDEPARQRAAKLAARFQGLTTAPRGEGGFAVMVPAALVGQRDRTLARLAELLGDDPAALRALVQDREDEIRAIPDGKDGKGRDQRHQAWGEPLLVAQEVGFDKAAALEEASTNLPGFSVVNRFVRTYPQGPVAAHLVGFLGSLSEDEADDLRADGRLVDEARDAGGLLLGLIKQLPEGARLRSQPRGRAGLEGRLDSRLTGLPGARVVEHDAADRSREVFLDVSPEDGEDIALTIDLDLQKAAEKALDEALARHGEPGAGGAAVLLDVRTGEILALASAPRFDPNLIASEVAELGKDPSRPFCHRAVAALPPGSTFKIVSSFAYFTNPGLSLDFSSDCEGALVHGQSSFHCAEVHGPGIHLPAALEHSCNIFFFRAADAEGSTPLCEWAAKLGFGKLVAPPIPLEQAGHVPGGVGPIVRNAAIGQGNVLATPLQVAKLAAIVAEDGRVPPVSILAGESPAAPPPVNFDPRVLAQVKDGLVGCIQRHGTASGDKACLHDLDAAGKTGTAERRKGEPNYAWFMGYYPASHPEVAFSVLIDRTNAHGGDCCGPVARKLLDAWRQK